MKKDRETVSKYRQQALEGDLMAMNNMGVCYAQGIGVVENHATTQGFEYSKQWLLHHLTDKGMDKNSSGISISSG